VIGAGLSFLGRPDILRDIELEERVVLRGAVERAGLLQEVRAVKKAEHNRGFVALLPQRVVVLLLVSPIAERDGVLVGLRVEDERGVQLPQVAEALRALGGFAGPVERGEKDGDQDGDDADHDEQLDERERAPHKRATHRSCG